jgi:hypothetical protein
MDAPGIRGDQQQLGHLVGRTFTKREPHSQRDADSIPDAQPYAHAATYRHAHINPIAEAYPGSDAVTSPNRDADAASDPYGDAGSNALTQSRTVAVSNAHSNAIGDAYAGSNAVTSPDSDADASADYRRHGAARWQGRRLLPRLAWPKRRDAALSRLCQRGRVAAGAGAEQLQRRHYRHTGRGGGHAVHGLCHRPRPRFGEPELSDSGYSIVSGSRIASLT